MRRVVGAVCIYVDGGIANFPNQVNANIFSRRALLIPHFVVPLPRWGRLFVSYTSGGMSRAPSPTGFGLENKEKALFLCLSILTHGKIPRKKDRPRRFSPFCFFQFIHSAAYALSLSSPSAISPTHSLLPSNSMVM